jgi:TonB-dependent starch-binding outer membrane protein SusC
MRMLGSLGTLCLFLVLWAPAPALAQATGTVSGVVTSQVGQPVSGANVVVVGTQRGTLTNAEGRFIIPNVPAGSQRVRASMIGYQPQEQTVTLVAGQSAVLDFQLQSQAVHLDEVVVTGTAGQARRREVGNSIATINVGTAPEAPLNIDNLLQGRAAGVTVTHSGGMTGSGAQIRLRGNTSAAMSNTPLIYVDGVRIRSDAYPSAQHGGRGSRTAGSPLNDINPNDIERIEIIKGAAATTLYGTEAAAGVMQIFTKRGAEGAPSIDFQADVSAARLQAFGPENEPYMRLDPWMRTGVHQRYSASVSGGSTDLRYFLSGAVDDGTGVLPNDAQRKYSVRGNFNINPRDNLQLQWNTSYTNDQISNPPAGNNAQGLLLNAYRGSANFIGEYNIDRINEVLDWRINTEVNHLISGMTATFQPLQNFTHRLSIGYDRAQNDLRHYRPFGFIFVPQGILQTRNWTASTLTLDYVGSYDWQVTPEFRSSFSVGGQTVTNEVNSVTGEAENLPAPGEPTLSAGAQRTAGESRIRVINAGVFLQNLLDWQSRYFLTLGLRVDGNSAFGQNMGLQPYPKASLSYVISEEGFWNETWGDLKLRAAYGHAGRAPGAFDAVRTWNAVGWGGSPAFYPGSVGNPDLGPERTREFEAGFDGSFLDRRFNLEFSYYHQLTTDALMNVRQVPSLGFLGSQLRNVGRIQNRGVELAVNTTPVQRTNLGWDVGFTLATNSNTVLDLGGAAPFGIGARSLVEEGGWVPGVFGRKLLNPHEIAEPVFANDGDRYVFGPNIATRTFGLSSELRMPRKIRLSGRAEYQGGHFIHVDVDRNLAIRSALPECEAVYPLIEAGQRDGLTAMQRARCDRTIAEGTYSLFVYPADFVKLRDLTLALPMPLRLPGVNDASLRVSLQNVRLWLNEDFTAWDPEMMQDGPGEAVRQITEDLPAPYRITTSLRLRF